MIRNKRMMWTVLAVSSSLMLHSGATQARGWSWAKRLPISQFTAQDTEIFHNSVATALDEGEDGDTLEWTNPDTGASGRITPLSSEQINGKSCRKTRFESRVGTAENISEFVLCRQPDGVWSVDGDAAQ